MFKNAFLLLSLTCACSPINWIRPQEVSFNDRLPPTYVCVNVPHEQFDAVKSALEDWNKSLIAWRRFVPVVDDVSACSYFVRETNVNMCNNNSGEDTTIACANDIGGNTIYLRKGRYEKATKEIVMHEFAHVLGAQHVSDTLMAATYDKYSYACPDVTTVAQVAAYNRLNLATLSWCYR